MKKLLNAVLILAGLALPAINSFCVVVKNDEQSCAPIHLQWSDPPVEDRTVNPGEQTDLNLDPGKFFSMTGYAADTERHANLLNFSFRRYVGEGLHLYYHGNRGRESAVVTIGEETKCPLPVHSYYTVCIASDEWDRAVVTFYVSTDTGGGSR